MTDHGADQAHGVPDMGAAPTPSSPSSKDSLVPGNDATRMGPYAPGVSQKINRKASSYEWAESASPLPAKTIVTNNELSIIPEREGVGRILRPSGL